MMALVADYGSDTSSSDSGIIENRVITMTSESSIEDKQSSPHYLASAEIMLNQNFQENPTSVFKNPFHEAEDNKFTVLEKHVKMTALTDQQPQQNKKICWNFRKGKCHYGEKCHFLHNEVMPPANIQNSAISNVSVSSMSEDCSIQQDPEELNKKKRIGLSNTLVPPKKFMKLYRAQTLHS